MSQEPKTDTHSFWAQVDVRGPDECWPWLGCRTKLGYGRVMIGGVRKLAPTKVRKILADERPDREIAADYGVAQSAIWAIKRRKIWRWVDAMDADQGGAVYLSGVLSDPKKEERQVLACQ